MEDIERGNAWIILFFSKGREENWGIFEEDEDWIQTVWPKVKIVFVSPLVPFFSIDLIKKLIISVISYQAEMLTDWKSCAFLVTWEICFHEVQAYLS